MCIEVNGKYGFLNKNKETIIQPKYDYASSFSNGLANVNLNGKLFYIDKKGTEYFED